MKYLYFIVIFLLPFLGKSQIYVDSSATGSNNGTSWTNAYLSLQDAIASASSGDSIWVAHGVYKPDNGTSQTIGDRSASFTSITGLGIFGGFDGTETAFSQRDVVNNVTVLSGDIGVQNTNTDNSYHVISLQNVNNTSVFSGFTISDGYAYGSPSSNKSGGGVYCTATTGQTTTPVFSLCIFKDNSAEFWGGAIYNYGNGGTVSPNIDNCTFINNTAVSSAGAIYNNDAACIVIACKFLNNNSNQGGAISSLSSSTKIAVFVNCFFDGNTATSGGAIYSAGSSHRVDITNCTFTNNSASSSGGAIYLSATSTILILRIVNSIFWDNSAPIQNEIRVVGSLAFAAMTYSILDDGSTNNSLSLPPNLSGGGNNSDLDPLFYNDYDLYFCSPAIDAGLNSTPRLTGISQDIDGNNRITNTTVDIGAFESKVAPSYPDSIIYVNENATGLNNGSSWINAYTELSEAMLSSFEICDETNIIWVAKGTYLPKYDENWMINGNPKEARFTLREGVKIYGGFAGNEPSTYNLDNRDFIVNETILSGDIGIANDSTDNVYHVLYSINVTNNTLVNGFTVTLGNANGSYPENGGAGMFNDNNGSPTISYTIFKKNTASTSGGGVFNQNSSSPIFIDVVIADNRVINGVGGGVFNLINSNPTFKRVIIENNLVGGNGAGMNNSNSSPVLTNVVIQNNTSSSVSRRGGYGGGIYNSGSDSFNNSNPILTNVVIRNNTAYYNGGGISNIRFSSPILTNVSILNNTATNNFGGGIYNFSHSDIQLTSVTIADNMSGLLGGGMYNIQSNPIIQNTVMWGNTAPTNPEIHNINGSTPTYSHSIVKGLNPSGTNNIDATVIGFNPLFVDTLNGDYRLQGLSPLANAGNNAHLPVDIYDLDNDLNTTETIPIDLDRNNREGDCSVDIGAYEYQSSFDLGVLPDTTYCENSPIVGYGASLNWYSDTALTNLVGTGDTLIENGGPNNYTYYVTDSVANCPTQISDTINVTFLALPNLNLGADTTFCAGDSVQLSSGTFSSYLWNTSETSQTVLASSAGNYSVVVTDMNGCQNSDTIIVSQNALPTPNLGADTTFCAGDSVQLSSGTFSSYLWNTSETSPTIVANSAGTYDVVVTDANGCQNSDTILVTQNTLPTPNLGADTAFCAGDSVQLSSGTFSSYLWNTSETSQAISVNSAGTYTVLVTDGNGCQNNDTILVTQNALPNPNLGMDTIICSTSQLILNVGTFSNYLWSNSTTNQTLVVNGAATGTGSFNYYVTVTDTNGCMNTDSIVVGVSICTGIDEFDNPYEISAYPNPTNGDITIDLGGFSGRGMIKIFNTTGKLVYEKAIIENVINLNLNQPKGIYFVEVSSSLKKSVFTIVKQ